MTLRTSSLANRTRPPTIGLQSARTRTAVQSDARGKYMPETTFTNPAEDRRELNAEARRSYSGPLTSPTG
jgi:hypothetical protein